MMPDLQARRWRDEVLDQHFMRHIGWGCLLWGGLATLFISYELITSREFRGRFVAYPGDQVGLAFVVFLFGFVPALLIGYLRRRQLALVLYQAPSARRLAARSVLLALGVLTLLALIPIPVAYNAFGWEMVQRQLKLYWLSGLPWLLSIGLASWRLACALPARPATPSAP